MITGKPLKILKAIKVVPHGVQPGIVPVKLHSQMTVHPRRDDLAVKLVELRSAMKSKSPELAGGLEVAANGATFGILFQLDVRSLDSRSPLRVFSGETKYLTRLLTFGSGLRNSIARCNRPHIGIYRELRSAVTVGDSVVRST